MISSFSSVINYGSYRSGFSSNLEIIEQVTIGIRISIRFYDENIYARKRVIAAKRVHSSGTFDVSIVQLKRSTCRKATASGFNQNGTGSFCGQNPFQTQKPRRE